MAQPVLELRNVEAAYGKAKALHGVSLHVDAGEVVALIGANGAGKTTTLRVISGLIATLAGDIFFNGESLSRRRPDEIVHAGIAHCPEERHVWPEMTVEENLRIGGYVCGSRDLIEFLYHRARPFLFSTSHPPAVTATCQAAFTLLDSPDGEKLIKKLWANTRFFKRQLKKLGFNTGISETPITPIMVGEAAKAFEFSRRLFDEGVLAVAVGSPTVPEGKARIRTIVTATHRRDDLKKALEILARVGKSLGIV